MIDRYKVIERYPELEDKPESIKVNVGRALQDLLRRCIDDAWWGESSVEINDYGCGPIEECNCSDFVSEYMLVHRRSEKHPASLKLNYEELPKHAKHDFELKAKFLLIEMKENEFSAPVDIDDFLSNIWIRHKFTLDMVYGWK